MRMFDYMFEMSEDYNFYVCLLVRFLLDSCIRFSFYVAFGGK